MSTYSFVFRSTLVLIASLLVVNEAWAQKKGGTTPPPPAPGTIYFSGWKGTSNNGYYTLMKMNGDGTNKSSVAGTKYRSYLPHGGTNWSLKVDVDYNDPGYNLEVFALSGIGQETQLTNDATIHVAELYVGSLSWGRDDSFVSYLGWWYSGPNANDVRGGLFVVNIDWSTGIPIAGPPQLIFEAEAYLFENFTFQYPQWTAGVNILNHDWALGGNQVVYDKDADNDSPAGIYLADRSSGVTNILPLVAGYAPQWSPDASRIAYATLSQEIWTILPTGTNATRITQSTSTKKQGSPTWSPNGAFLAYTEMSGNGKSTWSVMRVHLATGSIINLTSDLLKATGPVWR